MTDVSSTPEGSMSALREEPLRRVQMSWEDYLQLPERPRAEWVDGVAVIMNAPPTFEHGSATLRLGRVLLNALPEHEISTEAFLRLPRNRVRLPDLMVTDVQPEDGWVTEPPLMVGEVLSASTRVEDLVVKSIEYAKAGIGQYWIVDPTPHTLVAMSFVDGEWQTLLTLDDEHPAGEVELAGVTIPLDLRELLRS